MKPCNELEIVGLDATYRKYYLKGYEDAEKEHNYHLKKIRSEIADLEIIEQLENAIELIKQDGKDWLDDRDIPMLDACIKSLTALDKIRAEITAIDINGQIDEHTVFVRTGGQVKQMALNIIDKYRGESEE